MVFVLLISLASWQAPAIAVLSWQVPMAWGQCLEVASCHSQLLARTTEGPTCGLCVPPFYHQPYFG
jgi:hypothetical protein